MTDPAVRIRAARRGDEDGIWAVLQPTIEAGDTYPLAATLTRGEALAYWLAPAHEVFVAEAAEILGTYYLRANQHGGGSHVANCGYMTLPRSRGHGIGSLMCRHSLARARERGFLAMQFNFVVSANEPAVRLWQSLGFAIVGRVPQAFRHPSRGLVDVYVMHQSL